MGDQPAGSPRWLRRGHGCARSMLVSSSCGQSIASHTVIDWCPSRTCSDHTLRLCARELIAQLASLAGVSGMIERDPVARLLAALDNVRPISTRGHIARCPAHDDRHNSLKVDTGEDGRALVHCKVGCEAGAIVAALGWTLADLYPPRSETVSQNGHGRQLLRTTRYELRDSAGLVRAIHVRRDFDDGTKSMHWECRMAAQVSAGCHRRICRCMDHMHWGTRARSSSLREKRRPKRLLPLAFRPLER